MLSLPPAFNLSHDQTLQFKSYKNPKVLNSCSRQNSISTSHCPDISYPKYLGQRPHELLGQLFKERLSCCSIKAAYSTSFRCPVNHFFRRIFEANFRTLSSSCVPREPALSAVSLRSGAHSTALRKTVNAHFQFILPGFGFHLSSCSEYNQNDQKSPGFSPLTMDSGIRLSEFDLYRACCSASFLPGILYGATQRQCYPHSPPAL